MCDASVGPEATLAQRTGNLTIACILLASCVVQGHGLPNHACGNRVVAARACTLRAAACCLLLVFPPPAPSRRRYLMQHRRCTTVWENTLSADIGVLRCPAPENVSFPLGLTLAHHLSPLSSAFLRCLLSHPMHFSYVYFPHQFPPWRCIVPGCAAKVAKRCMDLLVCI